LVVRVHAKCNLFTVNFSHDTGNQARHTVFGAKIGAPDAPKSTSSMIKDAILLVTRCRFLAVTALHGLVRRDHANFGAVAQGCRHLKRLRVDRIGRESCSSAHQSGQDRPSDTGIGMGRVNDGIAHRTRRFCRRPGLRGGALTDRSVRRRPYQQWAAVIMIRRDQHSSAKAFALNV
jgi:hypothetical protein